MHVSHCRYCSKCHSEINRRAVTRVHGWCERCGQVVEVTRCKVSYWAVLTTFALACGVHLSATLLQHNLLH